MRKNIWYTAVLVLCWSISTRYQGSMILNLAANDDAVIVLVICAVSLHVTILPQIILTKMTRELLPLNWLPSIEITLFLIVLPLCKVIRDATYIEREIEVIVLLMNIIILLYTCNI